MTRLTEQKQLTLASEPKQQLHAAPLPIAQAEYAPVPLDLQHVHQHLYACHVGIV